NWPASGCRVRWRVLVLGGNSMRRVVFLALLAATLLPAAVASAETPAEKQMAQRIGNQLKQSGQLHNYHVTIKFQNGVAHLEGTVTSAEQRKIAVRLAQQ